MEKNSGYRFLFRSKNGEEKEAYARPEDPDTWPFLHHEIAHVFRYINCTEEFISRSASETDPQVIRQQKLQDYIRNHYHETITLSDILRLLNMNRSCFYVFMKQQIGMSLIHHINKERTEQAARMLTQENWSVESIGYDCGFSSPSNFYKIFKRYYGVSPGEFRK